MTKPINVLGFVAGLVVSIAAIVFGVIQPSAAIIAFGIWGLLSVALAWFAGASAEPGGNPFDLDLKAKFRYVPAWAWWVIAIGLVIAIVIAFIEGGF